MSVSVDSLLQSDQTYARRIRSLLRIMIIDRALSKDKQK